MIAGKPAGNFIAEGSAVSKAAYITDAVHNFGMSDAHGDGICENKITVIRPARGHQQ